MISQLWCDKIKKKLSSFDKLSRTLLCVTIQVKSCSKICIRGMEEYIKIGPVYNKAVEGNVISMKRQREPVTELMWWLSWVRLSRVHLKECVLHIVLQMQCTVKSIVRKCPLSYDKRACWSFPVSSRGYIPLFKINHK